MSASGPIIERLNTHLGEDYEGRDLILQEVHEQVASVWTQIHELVDTQDPMEWVSIALDWPDLHEIDVDPMNFDPMEPD